MQKLTQAELEIMQALWKVERGFLSDIQRQSNDRAPTTVSTILRILRGKGFVSSKTFGNANECYPMIGRDEYIRFYLNDFVDRYFNGSAHQLISFLNIPKEALNLLHES
jgi:BlaI family transcriptional regulator, penicillinase repressor